MADVYDRPGLFAVKVQELSLSGPMLLELMRAVLARGKPFRFCARGWSMMPFILDGDVITVNPLGQIMPGVGEVVAYVRPDGGNLVVHRVVALLESAVLIQGDNREEDPDEIVPRKNLLGRVIRIERGGRNAWMGLGPERYIIAWLSRSRLLTPLSIRLGLLLRWFSRR